MASTAARATVAELVTTVHHGGWLSAARRVRSLAGGRAPGERLRSVLTELVELTASLIRRRAEPVDGGEVFELELCRDDESPVDIDSLDPPLRATMRALLARVNGQPADAADQVDLVLFAGRHAGAEAIMIVLQWAVSQLDWCRRHHVAAPDWIAAA
jgi:hypothetical protein